MKLNKETFKAEFLEKLMKMHVKSLENTSDVERYQALSSLTRDYISQKWLVGQQQPHNTLPPYATWPQETTRGASITLKG